MEVKEGITIIKSDMPYENKKYGSGALCKLPNGDYKYLLNSEIYDDTCKVCGKHPADFDGNTCYDCCH